MPIPAMSRITVRSSQSTWKYNRRSNMANPLVLTTREGRAATREGILVVETQIVVCGSRRERLPIVLGEIRVQDVVRERGRVRSVDAVLQKYDAGNLRVVTRCEEHEPAVVAEIAVGACGSTPRVRDDLRGSRFPADVVSHDPRSAARAAGVHDHPHAVADRLKLFGRDLDGG